MIMIMIMMMMMMIMMVIVVKMMVSTVLLGVVFESSSDCATAPEKEFRRELQSRALPLRLPTVQLHVWIYNISE